MENIKSIRNIIHAIIVAVTSIFTVYEALGKKIKEYLYAISNIHHTIVATIAAYKFSLVRKNPYKNLII